MSNIEDGFNLTKPVWFYDGRKQDDNVLRLVSILWQDQRYVLCQAVVHLYDGDADDPLDFMKWQTEAADQPILFNLDGQVLNQDYES